MAAPKFSNHGCRLNAYEAKAMEELAQSAGLNDVIVVNTCAVTNEAVRKAKQDIRKQHRDNPTARVIVTGCAAQIHPEEFAQIEGVSHVIGNSEKMEPQTWASLAQGEEAEIKVDDIMSITETAGHLIDGFGTRSRAYVQVQNGCDHRCTFCIIPFGRGNSRSVPAGIVVDQIKRLRDKGFNEVVLTGVDITSWGADLPGTPGLGNLVQRILKLVPDLPRLRISSIDSIEIDQDLVDAIKYDDRLMPHLHLSLQAGDNMILKRMKRRHMREDAIQFCQEVRAVRPEIVFGADIIAGFPTETDAMFENSAKLVEECGLTWLHVFPFSPREGTPAARMPQLERSIVKERASHLRKLGETAVSNYLNSLVGRQQNVLMENSFMGRTEGFSEVNFETPQEKGAIVQVSIIGATDKNLVAA